MIAFARPWIPRVLLRSGLGALLGVAVGVGCNLNVVSVFTCLEDQNCIDEGGEGGVCEPNNLCTFPDETCATGKRWHDRAAELGGKCYDPADLGGGTDATGGTAEDSGTAGGSGSTSTGPDTATSLPLDDTSSGEPPPMTDSAGSSSGGMPASCDDLFGAAMGYELCEETDETCSFNAVLNQTSCNDLCAMFGSVCVTVFNNSAGDCASIGPEAPCDELANDQICVCAKP